MADVHSLALIRNLKPVATIFDGSQGKSKKGGKNTGSGGGNGGSGGGESSKNIELKEFFWDQFLIYLATGIALLTLVDASIQFFRSNNGVQCFVPMDVLPQEFTRDNAAYVNTFCLGSLSWSEYFTVFILIQGIVIVAPHYLWNSIFSGRFDFFVDLVKQLDRLRDSDTGDFRPKNIDIVKKLEQEFPEKWKWSGMFVLYIVKLVAQFFMILVSIFINIGFFPEESFNFVFSCPRNFNSSAGPVEGWSFPTAVDCSYPSFRVLARIQIANYFLLILALFIVSFGLLWCFKRHASSLGYKHVAKFAFSACLAPEEYVSVPFWKSPFTPRIMNDLDFLVMRLFRADSGHGRVFKDIQVSKELKNLVTDDHVKLHLLSQSDAIKDNFTRPGAQGLIRKEKDIRQFFCEAGFVHHRKEQIHNVILGEERLGNMNFEPIGGLRNRLFGFFQYAPAKLMAYDISFGTIGCSLILARGFENVVSVNFHPFYRNAKEVVKKEVFQVNYSSIIVQHDIFAQRKVNLKKTDDAIDDELVIRYENRDVKETRHINFIIVGPFVQETTKGIVDLHIERMNTASHFSKDCILLAIRPVMIAGKDVSQHFCKYEPTKDLFEKEKKIQNDLKEKFEMYDRVPVTCAEVECVFEFVGYSYRWEPEEMVPSREELRPLSRSPLSPSKMKASRTLTSPDDKDNRTRLMPKNSNVATTNPSPSEESPSSSPPH